MKVGVIGAGNMGSAFARRLSASGYEVLLTSRNIDEAKKVVTDVGEKARAVRIEQLAGEVDLIVAATPYQQQANALRAVGNAAGKVIIEISNPLTPDMSGLAIGHTTSAAEEVAKQIPGARIVKAFNTIFAEVLGRRTPGSARVQVFYAGDDENAKKIVRQLVESMGFEAIDAGPLSNARYLEPLGMLNIYLGYIAKLGTDLAPGWRKVSDAAATQLAA